MEDWRRRLIDLSYRNRLIKYRHLRASSLEINGPELPVLLADPGRPKPWNFYFPPDPDPDGLDGDASETDTDRMVDEAVIATARTNRAPRADEIVVREANPKLINRTLENLARKSNAEFQDKALRVLYVAGGFLDWTDPVRGERLRSPLVLVPVRLERRSAASPYQLFFVDDEEPIINPSLTEKLRHDAKLDLPEDFAWEDKPILTELAEIQAAVAPHGWTVDHGAVLGLFSFQKYVMYRDLLDNERVIVRHPLVRSLAEQRLTHDAQLITDVPELAELDEQQPARGIFSILDADASQRRCIEAAKRGQSFVMHGPPGTGKSQTIANIIAEAISQGQNVLFVSEKAAALDVVHNRLRGRGLGDFCLMLHGEHASRREVVAALHRALTSELAPRLAFSEVELSRHDNLRKYLNEQTATLHSPEPIFGDLSIREVYALLAGLHDAISVPGAPPAGAHSGEKVIGELDELRDIFGRLADRWSVSAADYIWRDFDATRFSSDDRARVAQAVVHVHQATVALRQAAEIAAGRLGWPETDRVGEIRELTVLCEHLRDPPSIAANWLDPDRPGEIRKAAAEAQSTYGDEERGTRALRDLYAVRSLDEFGNVAEVLQRATQCLKEAAGRTAHWQGELLAALPGINGDLDELPRRCELAQRRLDELCRLLGQPDRDATFTRIDNLVRLGRLAFDPPGRPQPEWLARAGLTRATSSLADARQLLDDYQRRRSAILGGWNPAALDADARRLSERFVSLERDRQALMTEWTPDVAALDTVEAARLWKDSETERVALLVSWDDEALTVDALQLTRRFREVNGSFLSNFKGDHRQDIKLVKQLRKNRRLPEDPVGELGRLASWQERRQSITRLITDLRNDKTLPEGVPKILAPIARFQQVAGELTADTMPLRADGAVPPDAAQQLREIAEVRDLGSVIDERAAKWSTAFGAYWHGRDTSASSISAACDAAGAAIELLHPDTDMSIVAGQLCGNASPDPRLAQAADQLESATDGLRSALGRIERFATTATVVHDTDSIKSVRQRAASIAQPFSNVAALADDLQRGAIEPAASLDALAERAAAISELHQAHATIAARQQDWAAILGAAFDARHTEWAALDVAATWLDELFRIAPSLTAAIKEQLLAPETARWPDPTRLRKASDHYAEVTADLANVFAEPRRTQLIDSAENEGLGIVEERCTALLGAVDTLYDWTDFRHYRERARHFGWDEFVVNLMACEVSENDVPRAFERAFWGRRLDALFNEEPELEEDYRGGSYQRFIADFQELDLRLVRTGPDRLIAHRNAAAPRHIAISNSEVAILRTEAGKLRRHKPVRQLLADIPTLLTQLKPCLMMSPLSVSHYLSPGHCFDLVLFDEASQVPPQDAINCVYRGKQLIVAGDSLQLPPTSFFQVAELGEGEDDEGTGQEDMESVLDSCQALLPEYYLRWHYRSQHEDLIAFSNDEIYDGELVTFPTPDQLSPDLGVRFRFVPDGTYGRGSSQTNPVEARAVARRLIECLSDGSSRSVGVIAFNSAQAGAISSELDLLRVRDPAIDEHFSGDRLDGPFVKHLESVQGDERDVILFSVGYGRDAEGKFPMSFGPLNKAGGHRRLNVAVTRARQKVELFASVTSKDFNLTERSSRGARLLRDYLAYTEQSGRHRDLAALGDEDHYAVTGIEREVAREVERLGYRVVHQLGAGFMRIDLAVVDSENLGRFVLAIESDGPQYRKTPTARDRDRLRDQVLRGLGWRLHRIWSLDWVRDRAGEIERLKDALHESTPDAALATAQGEVLGIEEHGPMRVDRVVVDLRDPATILELPWVAPYAREEVPHQYVTDDFHDASNRSRQRELARQILDTEAPVHIEYLIRRLAEAFGLQRVGNRVDAAARQAIGDVTRTDGYLMRGEFLWRAGQELDVVRRPADGDPRTRREIDLIPPQEIDLAFRRLLEVASGAADDDLLISAARILGFERTGEHMRSVLKRRLVAGTRTAGARP